MSKGMKTLWLAAALALTLPSLTAMADPRMMSGPMGGMHSMHGCSDRMAKTLGLTDVQQKQIDALHAQTRQDMRPLWKQKRENMHKIWALNPDDKNYASEVKALAEKQGDLTEKMIVARAQSHAKFYAILTDPQKTKLKQAHEDRKHMRHHHNGMRGGMGGDY